MIRFIPALWKIPRQRTLLNEIALTLKPDSVVYTDVYHSYDALDVSEFHHPRTNHSEVFIDEKNHINGIENVWNQAKRVLESTMELIRNTFTCFLKNVSSGLTVGHPRISLGFLKNGALSRFYLVQLLFF